MYLVFRAYHSSKHYKALNVSPRELLGFRVSYSRNKVINLQVDFNTYTPHTKLMPLPRTVHKTLHNNAKPGFMHKKCMTRKSYVQTFKNLPLYPFFLLLLVHLPPSYTAKRY